MIRIHELSLGDIPNCDAIAMSYNHNIIYPLTTTCAYIRSKLAMRGIEDMRYRCISCLLVLPKTEDPHAFTKHSSFLPLELGPRKLDMYKYLSMFFACTFSSRTGSMNI